MTLALAGGSARAARGRARAQPRPPAGGGSGGLAAEGSRPGLGWHVPQRGELAGSVGRGHSPFPRRPPPRRTRGKNRDRRTGRWRGGRGCIPRGGGKALGNRAGEKDRRLGSLRWSCPPRGDRDVGAVRCLEADEPASTGETTRSRSSTGRSGAGSRSTRAPSWGRRETTSCTIAGCFSGRNRLISIKLISVSGMSPMSRWAQTRRPGCERICRRRSGFSSSGQPLARARVISCTR